jgi:hypothetical protein
VQEAIEVTLMVTSVLERLGVRYVVGGSIASSLHGHSRATQDVDVVADLQREHVLPLVSALASDFYIDEAAVRDAVNRRSTFNAIHLATMFKVDVFVAGSQPSTRRELERRRTYRLDDPPGEIVVASPEDVVVQKLYWYRLGNHVSERQWLDALGVVTVNRKGLDLDYMRQTAAELEVTDLLDRMLDEAGMETP